MYTRCSVKGQKGEERRGLIFALVIKNPLSPAEHPSGVGVDNEGFERGLDQFVARRFASLVGI